MRYFFSTGEASGELSAVLLSRAIRVHDPEAQFEGIGSKRMRDEGFTLWRDHTGWASLGPLAALPRIPKLLLTMWKTSLHIFRTKPDLVILVDFGAFNVRLARTLRLRLRYPNAVMDLFPPSTWLDRENVARAVSACAVPVTAFERQYQYYKSLELPIMYFGHPLAGQYTMRAPRPAPPSDGGVVGFLPGSRHGELRYHVPVLIAALKRLRATRPNMTAVFGAATDSGERYIRRAVKRARLEGVRIERGVDAVRDADACFVASGTAVLEAALLGVPCVALYVITPVLVRHARKVYSGRFITLPNLILDREVVPEFLQEDATPEALAAAMELLLRDASTQTSAFGEMRERLGPPSAMDDLAQFAVALAKTSRR
jgi:lipid-A-disaccharide synthase